MRLTEEKLGKDNSISVMLEKSKSKDGRIRFPVNMRINVYKKLIDVIKAVKPQTQIGLCLEEIDVFKALNMENSVGFCNCVL